MPRPGHTVNGPILCQRVCGAGGSRLQLFLAHGPRLPHGLSWKNRCGSGPGTAAADKCRRPNPHQMNRNDQARWSVALVRGLLPACLLACLPACLPACLSARLPAGRPAGLTACVSARSLAISVSLSLSISLSLVLQTPRPGPHNTTHPTYSMITIPSCLL